jgi:hypothetical protein
MRSAGFITALWFVIVIGCKSEKEDHDRSVTTGSQEKKLASSDSPATRPVVAPDAAPDRDPAPPIDAGLPIDAPPPSAAELLLAQPKYQYASDKVDTFCRDKWSKRGELDVRMFDACQRDQSEGYANLVSSAKQHGDWAWVAKALPNIWNHWTKREITDYRMANALLRDEIDAYQTYDYESKQANADTKKLKQCLSHSTDAYSKDGSVWKMTMFCYKER